LIALGDIARHLGGTLDGDATLPIARVRGIEQAGAGEIAVVSDSRFTLLIETSHAAALVVARTCGSERKDLIRVDDPKRALAALIALFKPAELVPAGIEAGAEVAPTARLGARVFVASGAHIGDDAVLGDDVCVYANAVIGAGTIIGDGSVIHPNVTIYPRTTAIGRRVVIHAGTVIGSDGFGYTPNGESPSGESTIEKVPHLGRVEIEDDVEIGANCTIDRATLEVTRIGAGSKIDNLVQIGHNSEVGKNVILVAQAGVSGSVTIGDGAMIAGQAGIADHVKVGPGVLVGAQAGVHADAPTGQWLGTPALPRDRAGRMFAVMPHLPDYRERVRTLESKVEALQKLLDRLLERSDVVDRKPS
jgi:UDP-3-O-[3-hydroxymyristoyl] glucosamine N-acyltransferase